MVRVNSGGTIAASLTVTVTVLVRVLVRVLVKVLVKVPVRVLVRILVRVLVRVLVMVLVRVLVRVLVMVLVRVLVKVMVRFGQMSLWRNNSGESYHYRYQCPPTTTPRFRWFQTTKTPQACGVWGGVNATSLWGFWQLKPHRLVGFLAA